MRGIMLPVGLGLLTATAMIPSDLDAQQSSGASVMTNAESGAFLDESSLRALFVDAYVTVHHGGDDGPVEFFGADGHYRRQGGPGAVLFEGRFEAWNGAVCVLVGNSAPLCRRVRANGDGTFAFVNIAGGAPVTMIISGQSLTMASERRAPIMGAALRALLMDAVVAKFRTEQAFDGPAEFFYANGGYERRSGRARLADGTFEIRDDAVCVGGDGVAPRCRRVLANADGTYTFIDTADGTATRVTVTRLG